MLNQLSPMSIPEDDELDITNESKISDKIEKPPMNKLAQKLGYHLVTTRIKSKLVSLNIEGIEEDHHNKSVIGETSYVAV